MNNTDNSSKITYCRKCGNVISENSLNCVACGTVVENISNDFDSENSGIIENISKTTIDVEEYNNKKTKKRKNKIIYSVIGATFLAAIIVLGFFISKIIIKPQNIDTINGCPEFYNLNWGMSAFDVDDVIKLEHTVFPASRNFDSSTYEITYTSDSMVLIDDEEEFYLYRKKTDGVYTFFSGDSLDTVIITFSKEKYSLDEIVELYTKIYGQPNEKEALISSWYGSKTEIDVYDFEAVSEDGDKTIVVRYSTAENSKYMSITFDGDELDPCGFLTSNYAFDKKPEYYIEGLIEGEDYHKEEISAVGNFSGFSQYTLYPSFEYMGISAGMTAVEFNKDENEEYIGLVSYRFLLDEENATERISYIYSKLMEKYGTPKDTGYTSTYYAKMGIKNLTFEKMLDQISENTEGMYHIQWKQGTRNITLGLTISVDKKYYEGYVSYTN